MKIEPIFGGTGPLDPAMLPQEVRRPEKVEKKPSPNLERVANDLQALLGEDQDGEDPLLTTGSLLERVRAREQEDSLPGFIEGRSKDASLRFVAELTQALVELKDPGLRDLHDSLFQRGMEILARLNGQPAPADFVLVGDAELNLRAALTWLTRLDHDDHPGYQGLQQSIEETRSFTPPLGSYAQVPPSLGMSPAEAGDLEVVPGASNKLAAQRNREAAAKVQALWQKVLDLEAELGPLIPVPEQVSILDLIREWSKIIRELDKVLAEIEAKKEAEKPRSQLTRAPKAGGEDPELKLVVM